MSKRLPSAFGIPAFALALLASCTSLAGKESGDWYTAPDGLFSLPVPKMGPGPSTHDRIGTNPQTKLRVGAVSFWDDAAGVRAIEYEELPPGTQPTGEDLRSSLLDGKLAFIRQLSPNARIAREESVRLPDGTPAWFAVLEIPEGSTVVVRSPEHPNGRRLDSVRGFLHLSHGNLFLSLSAADDFDRKEGETASEQESARLKSALLALYSSMKFG